ncbi:hypothetical protein K3495_g1455 [Podosphaera aphanis]|nr:hypothetical protein K3495_g1455 [Podosphaera aphanis]
MAQSQMQKRTSSKRENISPYFNAFPIHPDKSGKHPAATNI